MPTAPTAILPPASAALSPAAPVRVLATAAGAAAPSVPVRVVPLASAGSAPVAAVPVLPPASGAAAPAVPDTVLGKAAGGDGMIYLTTNQGGNRDITFSLPLAYHPFYIRILKASHSNPTPGVAYYSGYTLTFALPQSGPPGSAVLTQTADWIINYDLVPILGPGFPLTRTRAPGSDGSGILGPVSPTSLQLPLLEAPAPILPPTSAGGAPATPLPVLGSATAAPPLAPLPVLGPQRLLLRNSNDVTLLNTNSAPIIANEP